MAVDDVRFAEGAAITPRVLYFIEPQPASPLGVGAGRRAVQSTRSSIEKAPWKNLSGMAGVVETEFVLQSYLARASFPTAPCLRGKPYCRNPSSERLTLHERLDFRRGLTDQLPAGPLRVVDGKSTARRGCTSPER